MITPQKASERNRTPQRSDKEEQNILESHIDVCLSLGQRRLYPPAGSWERRNVKTVLDGYRAIGWTVDEDGAEWTFRY